MPKRSLNLAGSVVRRVGLGWPAKTRRPSFWAAATRSLQRFSQSAGTPGMAWAGATWGAAGAGALAPGGAAAGRAGAGVAGAQAAARRQRATRTTATGLSPRWRILEPPWAATVALVAAI